MKNAHDEGSAASALSKKWFPYWRGKPGARLRLFCFPFAGGSASAFHRWLDPGSPVEVVAIQYPGRETRFSEPPFRDIDTLVSALAPVVMPLLDRPFVFFGYSLGTLVSLELAYRLRRLGAPAPLGMLLSAGLPPGLPRKRIMHRLPEASFITELQRYGGTPAQVLAERELMALLVPLLRADFEMVETYAKKDEPPFSVPFTVWGGAEDEQPNPQELEAWRGLTTGDFDLRIFPGGHFFFQSPGNAVREAVEATLGRWSAGIAG